VAHHQHDRVLWLLAATIGALSGCLTEDSNPLDVPSTSRAASPENRLENGLAVNGVSRHGLEVNGLSFHPVVADSHSPGPHRHQLGGSVPALSAFEPGIPPEVDPGRPTYSASSAPIADEPVGFDPAKSMLERIYRADLAAGGESFWFDRMLERQAGGSGGNTLYTKGRALYMYTHNPGVLGFAGQGTGANAAGGGAAYREAVQNGGNNCQAGTGALCNLYSVTVSSATFAEATAERRQYPSHWSSVHAAQGLTVRQRKFITHNNVAVTILEITNLSAQPTTRTVTATTPGWVTQSASADGTERIGTFNARYNLTTVSTRFSGEGFTASGNNLVRTIEVRPGESTIVKLQLGAIAAEIPESGPEYERYRDYEPLQAWRTHLAEYNRWWVDNVPYIDVPDDNVKKMAFYRTFLNRFNFSDADIPGNDYQFPVSVEGVLGYNNAIQLTQPMHMQDLKYFRNPLWSYGNWVSSGETSKCDAFIDNPGSFSWGNTYEQYIGREGWNSYKVHGGDLKILRNFARYVECDVKGQLAKYDSDHNFLMEYTSGALTGNDADAVSFRWAPGRQDRTESAFLYAGAKAAAEAYGLIGSQAKAAEMKVLAGNIKNAILNVLWDDGPANTPPLEPAEGTRSAGREGFGNLIKLNGGEPNRQVNMPEGILNGLTDFTIATWVNLAGTQDWSRVFDFGTGTTVNMFLTARAGVTGNPVRFAITTTGGGGEQQINGTGPLPINTWTHVAVTRSGSTGTLWVNGVPVGSNTNLTLSPSSLGNTNNNWIGRSQYGDPLLNGSVDEFHIFTAALTQEQIQALMTSSGNTGGNVVSYRFDEEGGNTVVDSSGNGRAATVETPLVGERPGKSFKHRHVPTSALIPWKDQQVFMPFVEGIVPNTDNYKQAFRYYTDADQFPIMPFYTANQADQVEAGAGGSNNFSNINSTLQAQVFAKSLREYPSEFVTPEMYRRLLEWLTWVQYVDGDNRFPNNNEFFFSWDPRTQTFGRSGIHHNILGAYNFMLIDDVAGVQPRLDDQLELWPIDIGWEHFAINNLRYHGADLTLVWDRPGGSHHYPALPEGYTVYVNGTRAFTVDALAHVRWNSRTGAVSVLDDSAAKVDFKRPAPFRRATDVTLRDNARVVEMFQKAGTDLVRDAVNLAEGKAVQASFTTTAPPVRATAARFAIDGFTTSGMPANGPGGQAQPGYLAPNTIWGTEGSTNPQDWFEVDLEGARTVDTVKLYFFSDKSYDTQQICAPRPCGNTYREPASYTVQYLRDGSWIDIPGQVKTPDQPRANYNAVRFPEVTTPKLRVLMTPAPRTATVNYGLGLKEIQVFNLP
jgi:hypothetical protein